MITKLSPSDNPVVKMGIISLRRVAVVVGNGMQTIIPHVFSLQRSILDLVTSKISASIIYKREGLTI